MKRFEENHLSMFKTVDIATENHATVIDAILPLKSARTELKQIIVKLGNAVQKQSTNISGYTEEKKQRRQKMTDQTFVVGQLVSAFAIAKNMIALDAEVNYSITTLNRMQDDEVGEICNKVYLKAKEHLADLADYGITTAVLNELKELIDNYNSKTQLNKVTLEQKSEQTKIIAQLIKDGKALLTNSFDKLMLILRNTNPEAYNAYVAARNSMPKRHAKKSNGEVIEEEAGILTGLVSDKADGMPIAAATVMLSGTDYKTETDSDGEYLFDSLPAGTYTVEISILDYQTAKLTDQKVIAGDETIADFEMLKA